MEALVCKECKGRKFRKISYTEYECEYCGAILKENVESDVQKVVVAQQMQPQQVLSPFPPEITFESCLRDGINTYVGTLFITPDTVIFRMGNGLANWHNFGSRADRTYAIKDINRVESGMLNRILLHFSNRKPVKFAVNYSEKKEIILEITHRINFYKKQRLD